MAANISKEEIHKLFVSNHKGTTLNENYILIVLPLLLQICHSLLTLNLFQLGLGDLKGNLVINFINVALPLILSVTILKNSLYEVCKFVFLLCVIGAFNSIILSRATKYKTEIRTTVHNPSSEKGKVGQLFTSQVRGCVFLSGAICILAVDMDTFPRKWAKTEWCGTGLMDLGVGTFALLMGLLWPSSINRAKFIQQLGILIALGMLRLVIVKNLNYNEHESEYGRHWNFFYTLALVKVAGTVLTRISGTIFRTILVLIAIGFLQHFILKTLGYETICLKDDMDRDSSFLVANKEGVISICGYIVLWTVGRLWSKLMKQKRIWCVCVVLWCFMAHVLLGNRHLEVCRRSANLAYVVWTSSCLGGSLLVMLCGDVLLNCLEDRANYVNKLECPDLYSIVNRRGLFHFLLANIITGLINLSVDAHSLGTVSSVVSLCVYAAVPLVAIHCIDLYRHSNGHKDD